MEGASTEKVCVALATKGTFEAPTRKLPYLGLTTGGERCLINSTPREFVPLHFLLPHANKVKIAMPTFHETSAFLTDITGVGGELIQQYPKKPKTG